MPRCPAFSVAVLAAMLLVSAGPTRGQEAAPDLPDASEVQGSLRTPAIEKIDQYVGWWVGRMKNAEKLEDVVTVRVAMVNGYQRHASVEYRQAYAGSAAARVVVILSEHDLVKQVQAAMALSEMPQVSIQPALEKMLAHRNPAVRYWALRGYQRVSRQLLAAGGASARKMVATLERVGRSEPSGAMVWAAFRALIPYPDAKPEHVKMLRESLQRVWLARAGGIVAGRPDVIEAYGKAEPFLAPLSEDDKKRVMQLLADALEAATSALVNKRNHEGPAAEALKELMVRFEAKLAQIAQVDAAPLQAVLDKDTGAVLKSKEALLAWNEYWKPILEARDVTPRPAPRPTTAAAQTAPAGGG